MCSIPGLTSPIDSFPAKRIDDMDKVKVGFIGCGGIAQFHFGHMEKIDEVNVVAV